MNPTKKETQTKMGNLSKEKIKGVIEIYGIRLCVVEIKQT